MKKLLFLSILIAALQNVKAQQVSLVVNEPAGTIITEDMLWNVTLVNAQPSVITVRLQVVVNDISGVLIYQASSTRFTIAGGTKQVGFNTATPISYEYNRLVKSERFMKAGRYKVCYLLSQEESKGISPLAQECIEINSEPFFPPVLNEPADKSEIFEIRPSFSWVPPAPQQVFDRLKYSIRVVELRKGQTAEAALEQNLPVYTESGIRSPYRNIAAAYAPLKTDLQYVWQVTAYDNNYQIKSEPFQFSVVKDSVMKILESSPYIKMKQYQPELGVMHQGYIKVLVANYSTDSTANLTISEEGISEEIYKVRVEIKQGDNYLLQELPRSIRLEEKKVYVLKWINSRGEQWMLRFNPKYYRK